MEQKTEMEIEEVVFESLEGCNEAFEKLTMAACCSTCWAREHDGHRH